MRSLTLALSLCCLLTSACASMKAEMPLPEELAEAEMYPVENRRWLERGSKPMFDLGPWQVAEFSRSWPRESVSGFIWREAVDREQRYSFLLNGGEEPIEVLCSARADINRWGGPESGIERVHSYELQCEGLSLEPEESLFTLEVGMRVGHLEWEGERLLVIPVSDLAGTKWKFQDRTGYVIEDGDGPIAAVEVLSPGRFWLIGEATEEFEDIIAAAASALLMYDDLLYE